MPQFTHFPVLPKGEFRAAMSNFIELFRRMPPEGEPFREFRGRLKKAGIWSRERLPRLLRFMGVAQADPIHPSELVRALSGVDDDAARDLLADRLWAVNPLLFAVVYQQLKERVHSKNEVLKYVDSFAYPGARITGPELQNWLHFGQGLELFKPVGIRLGLDERAARFVDRIAMFDIEEFLDEDVDEPLPEPPEGAMPEPEPEPAAPVARSAPAAPVSPTPRVSPKPVPRATDLPDPRTRGSAVPPRRFAGHAVFPDDTLADTAERLAGWWAEVDHSIESVPGLEAFDLDATLFFEDPERALFLVAVAAAVAFRLDRGPEAAQVAFTGLRSSGALDALYGGEPPDELPQVADAQALMLASLVARRCAEHPELAAELEQLDSAAEAFARLDRALGSGFFGVELFWVLRALGTAGFLRFPDLADFTALPDRGVRDTLFRLGFLDTPYAAGAEALAGAARAARRAAGPDVLPDALLGAFAAAAGCSYRCPHRRRCHLACRERADSR